MLRHGKSQISDFYSTRLKIDKPEKCEIRKKNGHPNHSLVGMDKLSWQRGNRSILINFDLENDSNQGGQIVEIDHDAKTAKIEAWSANDPLSKEKITPKNPRLTQLDPSQKAKLEKAVQHRLTHPIRFG